MMTFRKFWNYAGDWFVIMAAATAIILTIWIISAEHIENEWQYDRDFYLALQGREKEVKFYPATLKASKSVKSFLQEGQKTEEVIKALPKIAEETETLREINPSLKIIDRQEGQKLEEVIDALAKVAKKAETLKEVNPSLKIITGREGLFLDEETLVKLEGLKKLNLELAWWDTTELLELLSEEEKRGKVLKALKGELLDKELPQPYLETFPLGLLITLWFLLVFPSFCSYLYCCHQGGNRFYRVPWGKLGTYLVILIWLPGIAVCLLAKGLFMTVVVGPSKFISCDWLKLLRRRRQVEQPTEAGQPTETEIRPTESGVAPPTRWYVIENFLGHKETLAREKIVFTEVSITSPRELSGIAFPAEERERVFRVLGIASFNLRELATEQKELYLLEYEDQALFREQGKRQFEQERETSRVQYVKECRKRIEKELSEADGVIQTSLVKLEEYSQNMVAERRELEFQRKRLQSLQELANQPEKSEERFGQEFDKLCSLPHVEWVKVEEGIVRVYTDIVYIDYNSRRYEIGDFEISMYSIGRIEIKNLFNPYGTYDHPHVSERRPCLGNIREGVIKLIADYQFAVAAQVLIEFLHRVNSGGWYKSVEYWKEVGKSEE